MSQPTLLRKRSRTTPAWLLWMLWLLGCEHSALVGVEKLEGRADGSVQSTNPRPFDGGALADGGPEDARTDAAAVSGLSLRVLREGRGVADLRVLFHDAEGVLLGEGRSDNEGRVVIARASSLTLVAPALRGMPAPPTYLSYGDLSAGDQLTVHLPAGPEATVVGTYDVRWEGASPFLSLQIGGCTGTAWTANKPARAEQVAMTRECVESARSVFAIDESDSDMGHLVHGFLSTRTLPALQDGGGQITLSDTHAVQYLEAAAEPADSVFAAARGYRAGESFVLPLQTSARGVPAKAKVGFPENFFDALVVETWLPGAGPAPAVRSERRFARKHAPQAGTYQVDLGVAIGELSSAAFEPESGTRGSVRWQANQSLSRADHGLAGLELANGARWLFVFDAAQGSVRLPALPDDLAQGSVPRLRSLRIEDDADLRDYAAFKAAPQRVAASFWGDYWFGLALKAELAGPAEWDQTAWIDAASAPIAGTCNTLPVSARNVRLQYARGAAPSANGGSIPDGLYQLEQMTIFSEQEQTSIEGRAEYLQVMGTTLQRVAYYDATPTLHYSQRATFSGSDYQVTRTCGDALADPLLGVVPKDGGKYGYADGVLSLQLTAAQPAGAPALFRYRRIPSDNPACRFDCEAGVEYAGTQLGTGLARFAINKIDRTRDVCTRVTLANITGPGRFGLDTPYGWTVESAWSAPRAADCDDVVNAVSQDAIRATSAEGHIWQSRPNGTDCVLEVEVALHFEANGTVLPVDQHVATEGLAAPCAPGT